MNLIPKTNARIPITTPMFAESTPVTAVVNVVIVSAGNTASPAPKACNISKTPFLRDLMLWWRSSPPYRANKATQGFKGLLSWKPTTMKCYCKRTKREHDLD